VTRKLPHGGRAASRRWCGRGKAAPSGRSGAWQPGQLGDKKNRVEFRILGPLEVADGHGTISFDAPKQRTLLAVLLLHANEVVSSERLIDELWGERPPATASKVVQTYVSRLRKALGPDLIVTRPPGYLLRVEDEALDAERFRRLTNEARALAAKGEQAQAEALYRDDHLHRCGVALAARVVFAGGASSRLPFGAPGGGIGLRSWGL
jgi:hypothetical protein